MKKFKISVTGYTTPFTQEYIIEAVNRKQAKKEAEFLFRLDNTNDDGNFIFDYIKVKTLLEYKESNK